MKKSLCLFYFICFYISANAQLPMNRYFNPDLSPTYIWDNASSNGEINNGSGTWNTTTTNWVKTATGTNVSWPNGAAATTFGGNLGTGTAGTVAVAGTLNIKSLFFEPTPMGNFTITGGTALNLQNLEIGLLQTNQDATINTRLTGTGINYIKRGLSTLTLGGNNTITGNLTVSEGTLRLTSNTGAGNTNIFLGDNLTGSNNIALLWTGGRSIGNTITVNNSGTGTVTIGTYTTGFSAIPAPMILNRPVILFDTTNDRTTFRGVISGNVGTITIDGTTTDLAGLGNVPRVTFDTNSNTSSFIGKIIVKPNIVFQLTGGISPLNIVNMQPIEVNGYFYLFAPTNATVLIGSLSGGAAGITSVHPSVNQIQTLSIGNDNGNATYNGIIRNGAAATNLRKEGTGIQLLTGTNTHTGSTTINNGALGGTGSLTSTTTINSNGRIMGGLGLGNSGTFTTGNLVFTSGSTAAIDVYTDGATLSRVQVNGTCDLGTTSKINLMEAMPEGTFDIITSSGTMMGTLPTIGTNLSGRTASVSRLGNTLRVNLP